MVMESSHEVPDPRYTRHGRKVEDLEALLLYVSSLKNEPSCREPLTPGMLRRVGAPAKIGSHTFLSKPATIVNWLRLGILTGLRASKWVQEESGDTHTAVPILNRLGDPRAICGQDLEFRDAHDHNLATSLGTVLRTTSQVQIISRTQKNGDNGAKILFTEVIRSRSLCAVHAALRIRRHAQLLGVQRRTLRKLYRALLEGHAGFKKLVVAVSRPQNLCDTLMNNGFISTCT